MEYITIREAQKLTNKSNQYIYKLANKEEYKEKFKDIDGIKKVEKEFIINYFNKKTKKEIPNSVENNDLYSKDKRNNEPKEEVYIDYVNDLKDIIKDLQNQLKAKDKQIEELNNTIQTTQLLLSQQQQLQLQVVEKLEAPKEEKNYIVEEKSFFKRLFKQQIDKIRRKCYFKENE